MKPKILWAVELCALALPALARAQSACTDYAALDRAMTDSGIRLEGTGMVDLGGSGGAVQLWVAPSGALAIIAIAETGLACIVVVGENWTSPAPL